MAGMDGGGGGSWGNVQSIYPIIHFLGIMFICHVKGLCFGFNFCPVGDPKSLDELNCTITHALHILTCILNGAKEP